MGILELAVVVVVVGAAALQLPTRQLLRLVAGVGVGGDVGAARGFRLDGGEPKEPVRDARRRRSAARKGVAASCCC